MFKRISSLSIIFVLLAAGKVQAQIQSDLPRMELGGQYTTLHLPALQEWPGGFGGRFGYYLLKYVAVEGEFNYFPVHSPRLVGSNSISQIQSEMKWFGESQVLVGVKAGYRTDKFGLFGKVKPGFVYLTDRQNMQNLINQDKLRFAIEIGGVLEYYFSRHIAIRLDVGKTLIDFGSYKPFEDYPPRKAPNEGLQAGVGIVFRF
jgi:hypothetical protein